MFEFSSSSRWGAQWAEIWGDEEPPVITPAADADETDRRLRELYQNQKKIRQEVMNMDPRTTAQVKRSQSAVRERKEKAAGTAKPVRPPEGPAKAGPPGEADVLPPLLGKERARMAQAGGSRWKIASGGTQLSESDFASYAGTLLFHLTLISKSMCTGVSCLRWKECSPRSIRLA